MNIFVILLIVLVVIALWIISAYNFFVSTRARLKAAVQEIGNQLKRQADLIPNLEESVKGYLKHEKSIFDDLTDARRSVTAAAKTNNLQEMSDAGSKFADVLGRLQVVVESNPEIKGSTVVTNLMEELRDTSDKVMYARRLLIDLTADFNVKRATFPTSLVANLFHIEEQPGLIMPNHGEHLEVKSSDLETPKVKL
jgi:LemA protein